MNIIVVTTTDLIRTVESIVDVDSMPLLHRRHGLIALAEVRSQHSDKFSHDMLIRMDACILLLKNSIGD